MDVRRMGLQLASNRKTRNGCRAYGPMVGGQQKNQHFLKYVEYVTLRCNVLFIFVKGWLSMKKVIDTLCKCAKYYHDNLLNKNLIFVSASAD
jgi:hypothetical protein